MASGLKINCTDPADANVVLLLAPYDRTASFRKGTSRGPAAIVTSLKYQMETFDRYSQTMPSADRRVAVSELKGLNRCSPATMVDRVRQAYGELSASGAFVMLLGGEHAVSTGAFQALAENHGASDITVVQIDAHLDLRPDDSDYSDAPHGMFAHCTPMRHAHELGYRCVQVGIRAYSREEMAYARDNGLVVFEWGTGPLPSPASVIDSVATDRVYLTIDADGLDPACMPATGTPVPGGLEWYYAIDLIVELFRRKEVIGVDLVEVAPRPNDVVTEYAAAQLCYTMLALREKFREPGKKN